MGINRGTVLDLINDVHRASGFKDYNSYSYLFDQVDTMPESVEKPEPHWIPVTEKPIPKGLVLVTYNDGDVDLLRQPTAYRRGDIVAWCNLPEPYKGVTT